MKKTLSLLGGLIPFLSFAHDGHGHTEGFTIIHYMTEAEHLVPVLVAGGVLYWLYKRMRGKEEKA